MAATKKAMEVRAAKEHLADEIEDTRARIVAACGRVPERIIKADAVSSVAWRDAAETELVRCQNFPVVSLKGNTLDELRDILVKDHGALAFLA